MDFSKLQHGFAKIVKFKDSMPRFRCAFRNVLLVVRIFIMQVQMETPEDQVELYEALVEVLDASLEGEGELHQLHQVLVLVRILLSD